MHHFKSCTIAVILIAATSQTAASNPCARYSPSPVPIQQLPAYFSTSKEIDLSTIVDTEAIRQILSLYPLAIDGRAYSSLEKIFAPDAVANYSAPIGVLAGTSAIATALETALAAFLGTQHHLGASNVRICGNQEQAISATYYRAVHFLSQNSTVRSSDIVSGKNVLYAYGQYQDTWEKRGGQWKIVYRNLVYMGPLVTDLN